MTPMDITPLSPSQRKRLTEPQVRKLGDAFAASLYKLNPFSDEGQDMIENSWDEVRAEVEAADVEAINRVLDRKRNTITFKVRVKRGRTGRQVFADTGRVQYVTGSVADSAPLIPGNGYEEVEFRFWRIGRRLKDSEVEAERAKYGVVRDLEAQAQVNADHPEFADDHFNGDSWQDADGNWCCAYFSRSLGDGRCVGVRQSDYPWLPNSWVGGAVSNFLWINSLPLLGGGFF